MLSTLGCILCMKGAIQVHVYYFHFLSETEALLVENTALGKSSLVEDHTDREKEAATAPQSAKKPKKSLGSFFKQTST